MPKSAKIICPIVFLIFTLQAKAQEETPPRKFSLNGYISSMQSVMFDSIRNNWNVSNLIHNRLNFKWIPTSSITTAVELRNRFSYNHEMDNGENYYSVKDPGWMNLSLDIFSGKSFLLNTFVDRAWVAYEKGKFNITAGRQRINWSQTFVWNPNDVFNAYSFFDFDYVEKPGSDALRVQYYPNETSSADAAIKINREKKITAAGLYRFNRFQYDFQFLAGLLNSTDYLAGAGWSGAIKGWTVSGELSYFHPKKHFQDTTGLFMASVATTHSFNDKLSVHGEVLYSSVKKQDIKNFEEFYLAPMTVKNLSFTHYNAFAQASYAVSPLLNTTLALMYFPEVKGYFAGPSVSYSLSDNFDCSLYLQRFSGELLEHKRANFNLAFLRFKLNF